MDQDLLCSQQDFRQDTSDRFIWMYRRQVLSIANLESENTQEQRALIDSFLLLKNQY